MLGDHILYSHDFFDWERVDIARKNVTLITMECKRLNFTLMRFAKVPPLKQIKKSLTVSAAVWTVHSVQMEVKKIIMRPELVTKMNWQETDSVGLQSSTGCLQGVSNPLKM